MGGGGGWLSNLFGGSRSEPVVISSPSPAPVSESAPVVEKKAKKRKPRTVLTGMSGDLTNTNVLKQKLGE